MYTPALSIIIPVFNNFSLTRDCLLSLRRTTPGDDFDILVMDNGSTDATKSECRPLGESLFPERFSCIDLGANLGFAKACNAGARAAQGRHVFFLNNDTVFTENVFPALFELLQSDPKLGAVGPLLVYPDIDRVQHLGVAASLNLQMRHLYEYFPCGHPAVKKRRAFQVITAAALLMDTALFASLGGFFEEYRNGYEDIDLCARLTEQGLHCSCAAQTRLTHLASKSEGRFTHEAPNFALLEARCKNAFTADLDGFFREDGYETALTDWLLPYPRPPLERRRRLMRAVTANRDPLALFDLLDEEPCLNEGYEILAGLLEQNGAIESAASLRVMQTCFCPSLANYAACLATLERTGDARRHADIVRAERYARALLRSPDMVRGLALSCRRQAAEQDNPDLAALYTDWLAAHPEGAA